MRVSKMVLHWSVMFIVPTCIGLACYNPKDEKEKRALLEAKYPREIADRKKKTKEFQTFLANIDSNETQEKLSTVMRPRPKPERH